MAADGRSSQASTAPLMLTAAHASAHFDALPLSPQAPTAALMLTAACMVRNLHLEPADRGARRANDVGDAVHSHSHVGDAIHSHSHVGDAVHAAIMMPSTPPSSAVISGHQRSSSTPPWPPASAPPSAAISGHQRSSASAPPPPPPTPPPPPLGRVGIFALSRLHAACMRRHALETALLAQLTDVSARLRTAAALRHSAQLHSASLSATIGRLCAMSSAVSSAIRGPPTSMSICLSPTPPVLETAPLAPPLHHEFISELRRDTRHLVHAVQRAKLLLAPVSLPEPRRLLHALLHEIFGDLAQPTDQTQLCALLVALMPLHLAQLSSPMPTGGVPAPPLPLGNTGGVEATAFLQPHSLLGELAKGFFRLLPSGEAASDCL